MHQTMSCYIHLRIIHIYLLVNNQLLYSIRIQDKDILEILEKMHGFDFVNFIILLYFGFLYFSKMFWNSQENSEEENT